MSEMGLEAVSSARRSNRRAILMAGLVLMGAIFLGISGSGCAPAVREIPPDQPSPVPLRDIRAQDGGPITTPPRLVRYRPPEYPQDAIFDGITGTVIMSADINKRGEVVHVRAVRSIPIFDVPCIEAMQTWRFSPALRGGEPVAFSVSVPFSFQVQ